MWWYWKEYFILYLILKVNHRQELPFLRPSFPILVVLDWWHLLPKHVIERTSGQKVKKI